MSDDDINGVVTVCQGPPRCDLVDDAAVEAAQNGCPWCERITIYADGSESVTKPAET